MFIASLLVTLAVQIQASLVVFTPPILAPIAQVDVGVNAASVGLVIALIYLSSVPSALFSGLLINRLGAIRVSQLCVLCASLGVVLMSTGNLFLIVLGALIVGLGYGAVTPSSSTVLADQAPANMRSLIFSIKQTGVPIGGAIAGALVPYLMYAFGWKEAAIIVGLIGLAVISFAQFIQKKVDSKSLNAPSEVQSLSLLEPLRLVFSHRKLRELAVSSFAFSGMQMSLGSYLVVMLTEQAQLTVSLAGSALSIAMIAGAIARLFWGVLADYGFSPRSCIRISRSVDGCFSGGYVSGSSHISYNAYLCFFFFLWSICCWMEWGLYSRGGTNCPTWSGGRGYWGFPRNDLFWCCSVTNFVLVDSFIN
jgi:MFS family permease